MSIYKAFTRLVFSRLVTSVSGFVLISLAAKRLGTAAVGSFTLYFSLFGVITLFSDVGIHEGLTKRLSENLDQDRNESRLLGAAGGFVLVTSALVSVGLAVFATVLNEYMGFGGTIYLILLIFLDGYYKLFIHTLRGESRVGVAANIETAQVLIGRCVGVALILSGWGVLGLVYSLFVGRTVGLLWGWYQQTVGFARPQSESLTYILDYSLYSFISSVGGKVYSWADTLLIGLFMSQSWVGIYEMVWQIAQMFSLVTSSIATAMFPKISELASMDDTISEIKEILTTVIPIPILVILPAIFGSVVVGSDLLTVAFGPEFAAGAVTLVVLLVGRIVESYQVLIARALQGLDLPEVTMRSRVVSIVVNIGLNVLLIREFGILGAAVASALSVSINAVLDYAHLRRYFTLAVNYIEFAWIGVSSALMYVVLELVARRLRLEPVYEVPVVILSGIVLYSTVLLLSTDVRVLLAEFVDVE